ncbi:hypothetical protein JWJ90_10745 [Desulfobulbus rhabdoformis]|uniref:hypothetical protein n=1 Tax=Desulfobulbus rhabdoformis TaxID=34032 RepID=UPI00196477F8|nr:hypothetical protein [Desulfobulbus rhabdoformis]MBM9614761.1 hypothetical protein [Desulfobulbus rhabdoformis]
MAMGRPKIMPPENAVEIIEKTASHGCSEKTIARALGVSFDTWMRFREDHPELKEAYDQARAVEHDALVGVLFEKAMKGDATAAMFLLKCRHNYRDGGVTIEDNRRVQMAVVLPTSLNADQYKQLIEGVTDDE